MRKYGKNCKGCAHWRSLSNTSGDLACNYILDTGEPRGCDAENCDKYNNDPKLKAEIRKRTKINNRPLCNY